MAIKKVMVSMNETLLENVDEVAAKLGMSRSGCITMLLWNGIQMAFTPELIKAMKNLEEMKEEKETKG